MNKLALIVGTRGFFPSHLAQSGRKTMLDVLKKKGIETVVIDEKATSCGAVESLAEARACADLFKAHRDEIMGVVVTLPNFGDERAVSNTIRMAGLNVPVLVHAFPDEADKMTIENRRDSFCGKMSSCNNLRQYGIPYSLTTFHTEDPEGPEFAQDLENFLAVCRIVKTLKGARVGQIGARPAAFNTVRYSEKLLERTGISVETVDLSELLGVANNLDDKDSAVQEKRDAINNYTNACAAPEAGLMRMAKLGAAIDKWMQDQGLVASSIQCWTSLEENYGVVPCTLMSMMSNQLMASACETDVAGLVGMLALQEAARKPAALLDWNNNYGDDPNKGVLFHCSNLPADFFQSHEMGYQAIIAGSVGKDNTYGTITGRIAPGPFTYCRVSSDDLNGRLLVYAGEGNFTEDPVETFGGYGVFEIPALQDLLAFICENGMEHHVAAVRANVGDAVVEALGKYMNWDVYHHG